MKYIAKLSLLFAAFFLMANAAMAQFTANGTVTDEDGEPLIGATVLVKGTAVGTVTDFDGVYSLQVPSSPATLVISYTGFSGTEIEVSSANPTTNLSLASDVANLDEVVVTGLATSIKRSNLASSVASIPASEITGLSVPTTTDAALYGKFKGANIISNSGAPGGGLSVKLRGTTSISGSSQPLFIIDGVYIDNSSIPSGLNVVSRASGGGSTSNQDNPSNRLADIDPNDIETIEVLKGASAAAIYGSRASGGVIIITTKRGKAGKTKIELSQSVGWAEILNPLGVRQWTDERVLASNYADDIDLFRAAQSAGTLQNYEDLLYGNKGMLANTRLSISGGNDKTTFFVGSSYKNEEGIVSNTGYNKITARINVDHKLNDWLSLNVTNFYVNSSADRGFFNNDNSGTTMGISFTSTPSWAQLQPDSKGNFPSNPYAPSNFLETAALATNNEIVDRYIGGGTATANVISNDNSSLKFILRGGVDSYGLQSAALFPNTLQFQRDGAGLNGVSVQGTTRNINTNVAAFLVHSYYLPSNLSFRTQIGATAENFDRNTILGTASNLIGVQTNLDQSGSRDIIQSRILQKDRGFFVQEEINFDDKIIATVGLRGDKSSNNGDVNQLYYYPKASVAVNIHEFMNSGSLDQLKARIAYGQSGNFATFGSKYTALNSATVDGRPGVAIDNLRGNSEVGPERQTELEFGVDVAVLDSRVSFDATYYIKSVDDLLLNARLPSSSGFTNAVTNAAALENRGIEIGLNAEVLSSEKFRWSTRVSFWKNNATVTRLDVPSFTTGGFADFLGNFRIKEGESPTQIIGVGPDADDTGVQVFGDAEPDFQMSFMNMMQLGPVDLSFLFHWKQGGENINLSALLFDLNGTTWDYDDTDLDPAGEATNGDYRLSQLGVNTAPYIEDAGYLRLREASVFYNIPASTFNDQLGLRIGFSGTNMLNFFKYRSYDPEVSNFGGGGLSTGVEVTPFPSSKRFNFHVQATF